MSEIHYPFDSPVADLIVFDGDGSEWGRIVRCKDCKHYNEQEPGGEIGTCDLGLEDLDLYSIVEPDGFCAWGERREP